jgi:hypothetical protein
MLCYTVEELLRNNPHWILGRTYRPTWLKRIEDIFVTRNENVPMNSLIRRQTNDGYVYARRPPWANASTVVFNQDDFPRLASLPKEMREMVFGVFIQEARNIVCRGLMTKLRARMIALTQTLDYDSNNPDRYDTADEADPDDTRLTTEVPDNYPLVSSEALETRTHGVSAYGPVIIAGNDRFRLQQFWPGTFVRQHLPWSGTRLPDDYTDWITIPNSEMDYVYGVWDRIADTGFQRLADGEPEYNYFPRNHPMRDILHNLHDAETRWPDYGFSMKMITEEGYFESHPQHLDLAGDLTNLVNDWFRDAHMLQPGGERFDLEDVTGGGLHAHYIYMRNNAIYVRTRLQELVDLFDDDAMLQKYAGVHDCADHDDFVERLRSIFGYHGVVTVNPMYNFTPQDLETIKSVQRDLQDTPTSRILLWYLQHMGYHYGEQYWRRFQRELSTLTGEANRKRILCSRLSRRRWLDLNDLDSDSSDGEDIREIRSRV